MEGNRDDALKCLKIGRQALENGDRTRALKFLTKARRLDPSLPVDDLISKIDTEESKDEDPPSVPSGDHASVPDRSRDGPSHRVKARANGSSSSPPTANGYTEEQASVVRQIKRQKDYYTILGLEKECSVEDVRKAYRKLSLKVHPDKNKAPGAEDAFKAVSKAFQCLSNEESRKRYDLVGSEEEVVSHSRSARGAHHGFNGFYEADIDPDEIFRNFFYGGGGLHPMAGSFQGFRFGTGMGPRQGNVNGSGNVNLRTLIQILPVILLLLLNFLPSSEPIYSLSRSHPYNHQFITRRGVSFYVKSSKFEEDYPLESPGRMELEHRVEREYIGILSQNCRVELQRRQWGFSQHTPHCDRLSQFDETN